MNRQFEMWLRSGETNLLSLRLERESYIFLRLPKRPGFDYLFAQRQYRGDVALHADDFEYVGIYNAADGLVYDADYALIHAEGLDDTLAERSKGIPFYLLGDGDGLFYIYVERVYIIVIVRHAGNDAVFAAVHTGEASGKSFGRSGKYGEIQLIFLFVFVCHFIHFRNGFE